MSNTQTPTTVSHETTTKVPLIENPWENFEKWNEFLGQSLCCPECRTAHQGHPRTKVLRGYEYVCSDCGAAFVSCKLESVVLTEQS